MTQRDAHIAAHADRATLQAPPLGWVAGIAVVLTLALVALQTRVTLIIWALDGVMALFILLLAALIGRGPLVSFRFGNVPAGWRWILSAGLGVGLLATITLIFGAGGCIGSDHRWFLPLTLGVCAAFGAVCGIRQARRMPMETSNACAGRARWLGLTAVPFAALVLIVSTIPPGLLWQEEGFGYDVLEYHLQLPKEYFESGAITYLPHNVYANFPANAEMLYLAACQFTGQSVDSWSTSQAINALLAMLFVAAAWLVGREWSPQAGVAAAVLAAISGWLTYLSGIAYVENGMLLMGMLSCGCTLRAARDVQALRWCALAGVFAGLACGFKYPAVAMVALPGALLVAFCVQGPLRQRVPAVGMFAVAALLAFAPWLIKNQVMTANPVFPLLGEVFTTYPEGWNAEQAAHFAESHAPGPEENGVAARLSALARHVVFDPPQRFGPLLLILGVAGVFRRRSRLTLGLGAVLLVQILVWLFVTHLYARFAVPLLIPLIVLGARAAVNAQGRLTGALAALLVAGAAFNFYHTAKLYHMHVYAEGTRLNTEGGSVLFTEGMLASARHLGEINRLPASARVLLVGDARPFYCQRAADYCVVFNRSRFVAAVEESHTPDAIVGWLRGQGYTHVYVDWLEISRLRASRYGFPNVVTRSLFEQLRDAGLIHIEDFQLGDSADRPPYGTLYAVPGNQAPPADTPSSP